MTVKELIEILQKYPQDMEVYGHYIDDNNDYIYELESPSEESIVNIGETFKQYIIDDSYSVEKNSIIFEKSI